jgi:hypothetical protein
VSAYELDDDKVRACLENAGASLPQYLAEALSRQLTLPAPTKIGAVVRTTEPNYIYVRCTLDEDDRSPWIDPQDGERRSTERLGRITEILSEGVDQ